MNEGEVRNGRKRERKKRKNMKGWGMKGREEVRTGEEGTRDGKRRGLRERQFQ